MLPSKNRLPSRPFLKGRRLVGESFAFVVRPTDRPESRFGIVVGKSVFKKSTARNRLKRIIRKRLAENLRLMKGGRDALLIVKPPIAEKSEGEIAGELKAFLLKI
ncbi:MAG: ribonuclease P protein component [Parcubacteria group bacterium]|nr:ribonuclease P protein component [Parcubacteria group bacterium]